MNTQYVYNDPEQNEQDDLVTHREFYGPFNGLIWFRNTRIKGILEAYDKFRQGYKVTMDSYYDKAVYEYIGKPGMESLLNPEDQYFNVAKVIAKADVEKRA